MHSEYPNPRSRGAEDTRCPVKFSKAKLAAAAVAAVLAAVGVLVPEAQAFVATALHALGF